MKSLARRQWLVHLYCWAFVSQRTGSVRQRSLSGLPTQQSQLKTRLSWYCLPQLKMGGMSMRYRSLQAAPCR